MSFDIYEDIRRKIERIDQEYRKMHQRCSPFRNEDSRLLANTPAGALRMFKASPPVQLRSATPVGISMSQSRTNLKQSHYIRSGHSPGSISRK